MKLRPQALDCPSCGASIEVRHAARAKSAVCRSCGAQIDLTSPDFAVLGRLDKRREAPIGPIRLGLIGHLNGRAHEVIGRLRFHEGDEFWDEWLLLSENGSYLWLSEEGPRFRLHRSFTPTNPPALDAIQRARRLKMDGHELVVRERGTARISHLEGELTWKARVGDQAGYVDAVRGLEAYAFEWTQDELEFFRTERLSRGALREMFSLEDWGARGEQHGRNVRVYRQRALVLFVLAALALGAGWLAPRLSRTVAQSGGELPLPAAQLPRGVDAGQPFTLTEGLGHLELSADVRMPVGLASCELQIVDPTGAARSLFRFSQEGARDDWGRVVAPFRVAQAGLHRLRVLGTAGPAPADGSIRWQLRHRWFVGRYATMLGVLLGVLALFAHLRANWEQSQARDPSLARSRDDD